MYSTIKSADERGTRWPEEETTGRTAVGRGMAPWLAGFGAVAGAGAALGGYALLYEPFDVRAERLTVRLMRDRRGLPVEGLRILHISDTLFRGADRRERAKIEQVRRATADAQFDLLIHTGDFLHNDEGLENVLALFEQHPKAADWCVCRYRKPRSCCLRDEKGASLLVADLLGARRKVLRRRYKANGRSARRGALRKPLTIRALSAQQPVRRRPSGVNDIAGLRRALEGRGVRFLDNRGRAAGGDGRLCRRHRGLAPGRTRPTRWTSRCSARRADYPAIAQPGHHRRACRRSGDLILAGHTHGGQIVLTAARPRIHADGAADPQRGFRPLATREDPRIRSSRFGREHPDSLGFAAPRHLPDAFAGAPKRRLSGPAISLRRRRPSIANVYGNLTGARGSCCSCRRRSAAGCRRRWAGPYCQSGPAYRSRQAARQRRRFRSGRCRQTR